MTTKHKKNDAKLGATANKKEHKSASSWQEHQKNYSDKAKEMFENFSKNMKGSPINKEKIMENHNKNLNALSDANKMAIEVLKSIAKLQSDYIKQTFEDINSIIRSAMAKDKTSDKNDCAQKMQEAMHRTLDHSINLGSLMANSHKEIHSKLHDRFREGMEELHNQTKIKH